MNYKKQYVSEYRTWCHMRQRCSNPNDKNYNRYGGRGIRVCESWDSFESFLRDMGPKPSARHSIDRLNNDGNYEPSNCAWRTQFEQCQNTSQAHLHVVDGVTASISGHAKLAGIKWSTVHHRLRYGWTLEEALKTPVKDNGWTMRRLARVA